MDLHVYETAKKQQVLDRETNPKANGPIKEKGAGAAGEKQQRKTLGRPKSRKAETPPCHQEEVTR